MRSLATSAVRRCVACRLPRRWCICAAHRDLHSPLFIEVLMHVREQFRPSSTGMLVRRLFPESRLRVWSNQGQEPEEIRPERPELWILHPQGEPLPEASGAGSAHVVLLDGSWSEAAAMAKTAGRRGRLVSLPMTGESRYWLRDQQDGGRFSTVEALMSLLRSLGLNAQHDEVRLQFELHVYANLRARGRKEAAEKFLAGSPVAAAFPGLIAQLNARRPREP
ncbi:MAG: DTW domain-containing protein [Opitutaceae bacterium]|nr:DTW domain-containing protein [Opitutaceae bacterium]